MNERGFLTVIGALIVSLLFLTSSAVMAVNWTLTRFHLGQKICINESLVAQRQILNALRGLFSLNPQAKALILKKRIALAQLTVAVSSGNPVLIARAKARLKQIEFMQRKLSFRQREFIGQAHFASELANRRIPSRLVQNKLGSRLTHPFGFAVQIDMFDETAPSYKTADDFTQRQKGGATFVVSLSRSIAPVLRSLWPSDTVLSGTCVASLKKGAMGWKTVLLAAK